MVDDDQRFPDDEPDEFDDVDDPVAGLDEPENDDVDDWYEPRRRPGGEGVRIIGAEEARAAYEEQEATRREHRERPLRAGGRFALPEDVEEPDAFEEPEAIDDPDDERPRVGGQVFGESPSESRGTGDDQPTGPMELPHWTEPPSGESPIVGRGRDESTGPRPRFRDDERDWAESDVSDLADEGTEALRRSGTPQVDDDEAFAREVEERRRQVRQARLDGAAPPPTVRRVGPRIPPPSPPRAQPPRPEPEPEPEGDFEDADETSPGSGAPREGMLEPGMPEPPPLAPGAGGDRDLPTAVLTGLALGVLALLLFNWGRGPTAWLIAVIAVLASGEMYAALRARGYRPANPVGLAATAGLVLASYDRGYEGFVFVLGLAVITTVAWFLISAEDARPTVNMAMTLLPIGFVGAFAGFGGLLLWFPNGIGLILGVVIAGVAYDVIGYFIGSRVGTRYIAPSISPNKTLEGLIAGVVAAIVFSLLIVRAIHPWDLGSAFWLGIVVGIAAPIGDLSESMLKRDIGIKDFGSIIPGHGGVLDRFDAILFSLPPVFFLARVLELF